MPNGESKNWIRFQITLESFFFRFGHWPSEIHLYPSFIAELEEKFSAADFGKFSRRSGSRPMRTVPSSRSTTLGTVTITA